MNWENDEFISFIRLNSIDTNIIRVLFVLTSQTKPTKRDQLNKLNVQNYKRCTMDDSECCICCQSIQRTEYIRELNCHHFFHKKCIDNWLFFSMNTEQYNVTCPICRTPVTFK